jgi:hypothetical protein
MEQNLLKVKSTPASQESAALLWLVQALWGRGDLSAGQVSCFVFREKASALCFHFQLRKTDTGFFVLVRPSVRLNGTAQLPLDRLS